MVQRRCGWGEAATRLVMVMAIVAWKSEPKDAVGRAAEIANVCDLSLVGPVPVATQSAADLRAFMHRSVEAEPAAKAETEYDTRIVST